MQRISELIRTRAGELLESGVADQILGWENGGLAYDPTPAFFTADNVAGLVYNSFCGINLSKYLIEKTKGKESGKVAALLKPCDTYSFNQLLCEHRIDRDKVYVVGVGCSGMLDVEKLKARGFKGIKGIDEKDGRLTVHTLYGDKSCPKREVLMERCISCKGGGHVACDEVVGEELTPDAAGNRFAGVEKLESLSPDDRFDFWRGELSRCIRCNACRNACPACSCNKCVFDNSRSGMAAKANSDDFEQNMFHIIRAFHVAGRCTDCGECSRVCPQGIPLHLLNRKLIKDVNELYGDYQAGAAPDSRSPLISYTQGDAEPDVIYERGGAR